MKHSVESLLTRGISIGSKFLLLGYTAKVLSLADYGSFQLVSYFILISTTIFGLEYYNISNREIAENPSKNDVYQEHLAFYFRAFPIVLLIQIGVFLAIFPKELITITNVVCITIIGLCDYLSQEVYRYLMINKEYRKGNIQLIYKSLVFLILIFLYVLIFKGLNFDQLLLIMVGSYLLLLLFAYHSFSNNLYNISLKKMRILSWRDFKVKWSLIWPFVVLVLFLKGIEFSDKFLIGRYEGLENTGIYSFIFAIASVINVFVVSGFYIIYLPQLIGSYSSDKVIFLKELRKFSLLTIGSSVLLAIGIYMIAPFIIRLIDKEVFLDHLDMLGILLIGFVLNNISLIPHLFLYVSHKEKSITVIMGIALAINLSLNLILIPKFGIYGAAYSFLITYVAVLILKSISALRVWKRIAV